MDDENIIPGRLILTHALGLVLCMYVCMYVVYLIEVGIRRTYLGI